MYFNFLTFFVNSTTSSHRKGENSENKGKEQMTDSTQGKVA
jgi:hypothetical protein